MGLEGKDDACAYKLNAKQAILGTVDFFTPIVDDPYDFGGIACANSLSDIYAKGGKPLFALNLTAFPMNLLSLKILLKIIKGASDKANEAEVMILGGHTVDDEEPKFGMAVVGVAHPHKIISNASAKEGEVIILTKPLGTGIISTATKRGGANISAINEATLNMLRLNKYACEVMLKFNVSAATDVTGYGLLGHLLQLLNASKVSADIFAHDVPIMNSVRELAEKDFIPGGTSRNLKYVNKFTKWNKKIDSMTRLILADAQTSGGLLICIQEKYASQLLTQLKKVGDKSSSVIGRITKRKKEAIFVKP